MSAVNRKKTGPQAVFRLIVLPLAMFAVILGLVIYGINYTMNAKNGDDVRIAEDNIRKAVVSCYTIEGRYPDNFQYLTENYGVHIDEDKYYVHYEVFASNIMPEITVVERGEQ